MEPDRVLWPDGTTTKKPSPVRGKKTKKVPLAVSKHGLYGTIVAQFGNKKKTNAVSNTVATSNVVTTESPQSTPSSTGQAKSTSTPEKPKQVQRCKFQRILFWNLLKLLLTSNECNSYPYLIALQCGKQRNMLICWFYTRICYSMALKKITSKSCLSWCLRWAGTVTMTNVDSRLIIMKLLKLGHFTVQLNLEITICTVK